MVREQIRLLAVYRHRFDSLQLAFKHNFPLSICLEKKGCHYLNPHLYRILVRSRKTAFARRMQDSVQCRTSIIKNVGNTDLFKTPRNRAICQYNGSVSFISTNCSIVIFLSFSVFIFSKSSFSKITYLPLSYFYPFTILSCLTIRLSQSTHILYF